MSWLLVGNLHLQNTSVCVTQCEKKKNLWGITTPRLPKLFSRCSHLGTKAVNMKLRLIGSVELEVSSFQNHCPVSCLRARLNDSNMTSSCAGSFLLRGQGTAELLQYAVNTLDEALGHVCPAVSRCELLEEDASVWVAEQLRARNLWPSEAFALQLTAAFTKLLW